MPEATTSEPLSNRMVITELRGAVQLVFGDPGLSDVSQRLPERTRDQTVLATVIGSKWLPSRYVLDWYQAIWDGPAQANEVVYRDFFRRFVDSGYGRVHRFFFARLPPDLVFKKAPASWRERHSHGELHASEVGNGAGVLTLAHHPNNLSPLWRMGLAECWRTIVALTNVQQVAEKHSLTKDGALRVELTWRRA